MDKRVKRLVLAVSTIVLAFSLNALPAQSGEQSGTCSYCSEQCPPQSEIDLFCETQCIGSTLEEGQCDPHTLACVTHPDSTNPDGQDILVTCNETSQN